MKKFILLVACSILILSTSCKSEKKNTEKPEIIKFENSDLTGSWVQKNKIKKSEKGIIRKIDFKDNFTAEIEIIDSISSKTIIGNWNTNKEKKIGSENFNISFKSNILLTFMWNKSHKQILSLSIEKHNEKVVLISNELKFEKE